MEDRTGQDDEKTRVVPDLAGYPANNFAGYRIYGLIVYLKKNSKKI